MILEREKYKYFDKNEWSRIQRGSGFYHAKKQGRAFYLPKYEQVYGESFSDIINNVFKFVNSNKDNIKNIAETLSSASTAASTVSKNVTDTINNVKKKEEPTVAPLTLEERKRILGIKSGSGFIVE